LQAKSLAESRAPVYNRTYNAGREYEWDQEKARANHEKHGIRFARAIEIFADERLYVEEDTFPFEARFAAIGKDDSGVLLVVVFTWRAERIRVISAWKADQHERAFYEGGA
jgi:uncharacterized protein